MMKLSKILREEHVIDGSQAYQEWQKFQVRKVPSHQPQQNRENRLLVQSQKIGGGPVESNKDQTN